MLMQFTPAPAEAAVPTAPPSSGLSATSGLSGADVEQLIEELVASDLVRSTEVTATSVDYVFEVPTEVGLFELPISVPIQASPAARKGIVQTNLSFGRHNFYGAYVDLNRWDQGMIVSGGAAAVNAALCAVPAVGAISCGVIFTLLLIASNTITTSGMCPRVYRMYLSGRAGHCA
ncbi:hypothetical protein AA0Z99_06295 [Agrococcus sp. 1P02AA]|uniref:hypothetical protein n=1 Tax=Agrococcus sp. 1P02AA TaxID=3132259 RepID=UPI0039A4827D